MPRPISPAILFRNGAEEAAAFYLSVFPGSTVQREHRDPDGKHVASTLHINGGELLLISGGPECDPSIAVSLMVYCDTQDEIDHYWDRLLEGGQAHACGWLTDRFGVTWQVTPSKMGEWMTTGTPEQGEAAFQTLIHQVKIDIPAIEAAWQAAGP